MEMLSGLRVKKLVRCIRLAALGSLISSPVLAEQLIEEVVVVGSHIKGAQVEGILPVSSLGKEDLDAVGAVTTDELIISLPQSGGQSFNGESQGPNSARGDVASANLRGLGSGNTLVLLNGRRMVLHPTTQSENSVPVQIVNINAIPGSAISRLEVLRDGAGALYGADATAGVLNHVIDADYEGTNISVRHGFSEGTELDETSFNFKWGQGFNGGATHLVVFGSLYDRTGMPASDRRYSRSDDRRDLASGPFEGDSQLRNTSTDSPWGGFALPNSVTVNGSSVSRVHVQPCGSSSIATLNAGAGLCLGSGNIGSSLRADEAPLKLMTPDSERFNILAMLTHEFDSGTEFFSELNYYDASSHAERGGSGVLSSAPIVIGADNPFNPFGSGPGRLPGLNPAEVPLTGLDLTTDRYRVFDAGNRTIDVDSYVYRILGGFRGDVGDWSWEVAGLYSEANTEDTEGNRTSSSALQAALLSSNPATAYNAFNGGDINNPQLGDTTLNSHLRDVLNIDVTRDSTATLALYDFKMSNPNLFTIRGNDVGAAFGVEWRREEVEDDRDERVDGTITFVNANGDITSDVVNTSPTPDFSGSRQVFSMYSELQIPLITEDDDIPLVQSVDVQLAARYESFSDIEDEVLKPKVAVSWQVNDWLMFRGSYAEGFRAPNLEQVNATEIRRVLENETDIQACIQQGIIASVSDFANCTIESDVEDIRGGNEDLSPEDNESYSFGIVLTPLENLTFTMDLWHIEQVDLVGLVDGREQMDLDAVLREQGSSNPNVIRDSVTGQAIAVNNQFLNLGEREIEGVDFSVIYDLVDTSAGDFRFKLDVATLREYEQIPSAGSDLLLAAGLPTSAGGSLLKQNDNPYTRASASITWNKEQWGGSLFARYVGGVEDTSTSATVDGETQFLPVDEFIQVNGSLSYTFLGGSLDNTTVRLGMNNIFNEQPPLADETFGFADNLHSNRGRYFFLQLSKSFE